MRVMEIKAREGLYSYLDCAGFIEEGGLCAELEEVRKYQKDAW